MHMVNGYIEKNYLAPTSVPQSPAPVLLSVYPFKDIVSVIDLCVCALIIVYLRVKFN